MVICFVMIKSLPNPVTTTGAQAQIEEARREALGYNKPIMEQLGIYIKNVFTDWNWGVSWRIDYMANASDVVTDRIVPTLLINIYSLLFSVPIGILFGVFAALKKNKWQDQVISTGVMLFISVPSFVYAFLVQYIFAFKAGWLPAIASSLSDAGGSYLSPIMTKSLILPVLSLSFGTIAGLTRSTRAELTEALTSDYKRTHKKSSNIQTRSKKCNGSYSPRYYFIVRRHFVGFVHYRANLCRTGRRFFVY